jgi:hypothetical protein
VKGMTQAARSRLARRRALNSRQVYGIAQTNSGAAF